VTQCGHRSDGIIFRDVRGGFDRLSDDNVGSIAELGQTKAEITDSKNAPMDYPLTSQWLIDPPATHS
jgi:hypothetical protein